MYVHFYLDTQDFLPLAVKVIILSRKSQFLQFNLGAKTDVPSQKIKNIVNNRALTGFALQVNGVSVEEKTHSEVVAAIKTGGDETRLLVVDPETDAFFKRCRVAPTSDHLTGESAHRQLRGS